MAEPVAILVVNGGEDPPGGRWLELSLTRVRRHTTASAYHLYIWNNNTDDAGVAALAAGEANATSITADPQETLAHRHAVPLQRLYERARAAGHRYIITLDTDAFPIRDGWLDELVGALSDRVAVSGVWRDELSPAIEPYVHPSCLVTTVAFIEQHRLCFDTIPSTAARRHDTLSTFTTAAQAAGLACHPLHRSNRNQFHHLLGGIYGDLIYHHGAGSRVNARFWGEPRDAELEAANHRLVEQAARLLVAQPDRFLAWLRGAAPFVMVLGMHRSGTSCLAGLLECCGLFLGTVNRSNKFNPKGNFEAPPLIEFHDRRLSAAKGSWWNPPDAIPVHESDRAELGRLTAPLLSSRPSGVKEPRALLFTELWQTLVPDVQFVGSFRHPDAVARSLAHRNQLTGQQSYPLWNTYNERLVDLHRRHPFPLVEYDLADPDNYVRTVGTVAVNLGLDPAWRSMRAVVSDELEHHRASNASVPEACRGAYNYLREHRYQPSAWELGVLELCDTRDRARQRIDHLHSPGQRAGRSARQALGRIAKAVLPAAVLRRLRS